MRVVLDTNVLLDLWVFRDPRVAALAAGLEHGELRPLRSAGCDAELACVLARPRFALAPTAIATLLAHWHALAQLLEPDPAPQAVPATLACRDPQDHKFLALAFAGGAEVLLTQDRDLLRLARRARRLGLRICAGHGFGAA